MRKPSRRVVVGLLVLGILGFLFGVWVLLHPASVFVQPWRAVRAEAPVNGVLFGPYPVEADFADLKKRGVTTIVSLLKPSVPYEKVLLEKEQELAKRYGMTVQNFPMGSILGQKFGDDYVANSKAAAQAALDAKGVAYIHCYLGLHRAKYVQQYLAEQAHVKAEAFEGVNAVSDADHKAERRARELSKAGRYEESQALLATIQKPSPRTIRVQAWNYYRMQKIDQARAAFQQVLSLERNDFSALTGLAYCDLFENRLPEAEKAFTSLAQSQPKDVSVLDGLASTYYRQSRWVEAKEALTKLLAIESNNPDAKHMLERVNQFMQAEATEVAP